MKYDKVAAHLLKKFYKGDKMLIDTSDHENILICFDNVMVVSFPEKLFPFNSDIFETSGLHRMTEYVENECLEARLTNHIISFERRKFYEIMDENNRLTHIDARYLDLFGFNEPLFYIHSTNPYMPVLVYETFGGASRRHWQAAIMPARIEV